MTPKLAQHLVAGLKEAGIDFISFLPESRLSDMIPLIRDDPSFMMIYTCHEGTVVTLACGAALVGKRPAVYTEATGFVLSMYNPESAAMQFGLPILYLISYVGSPEDKANSTTFSLWGRRLRRRSNHLDYSIAFWKTVITSKLGWSIWPGRRNRRRCQPACYSQVSSRLSLGAGNEAVRLLEVA